MTVRSYYVWICAKPGQLLSGIVKNHFSSRFEKKQQADDLLATYLELDGFPDGRIEKGMVLRSRRPPSILAKSTGHD